MVACLGSASQEQRRPNQSAARFLGIVAAIAGQLYHRGRFRLGGKLVCAGSESATRHDGVAFRKSCYDGAGSSLCHFRQVRVPRSGGDRNCWRRGDVDERNQRIGHDRKLLGRVERSAPYRHGVGQPRPQSSHVGATCVRRRSEIRMLPECAEV